MIRVLRAGKSTGTAIAEGSRLPTTFEARLIRLSTYGDMWMPVGDSENRWMQISATDGRRGKTHEELYAAKPGWGTNATNDYGRTMTWIDVPNGPDGETPARRLKEDSSTGLHGITNGGVVPIAAEVGQVFTASIHAKAEALGRTHAYVGIGQDANGTELGAIYKVFDLSNGTVLSGTKTTGSSQPTAGVATITAVGSDGWYRISFAATLTAGNRVRFHAGTGYWGDVSYAGNNSATLLVWGPQLEKGSLPSVYTSGWSNRSLIRSMAGPVLLPETWVNPRCFRRRIRRRFLGLQCRRMVGFRRKGCGHGCRRQQPAYGLFLDVRPERSTK